MKFIDLTGLPPHGGKGGMAWDNWYYGRGRLQKSRDGVITKTQIADFVRARGW